MCDRMNKRMGECRGVYEKQQRTGQTPGGFTDAYAAGDFPGFRGLRGKLRN